MYTVKYYNHEETVETAAAAISAAKELAATYGQGNKAPVIVVETEEEADEMVKMLEVARESYPVRIGSIPVI